MTIPWLRKVTLWVCSRADAVVTVADYQKKIAERNLKTKKALAVLPLRINISKFPFYGKQLSFPIQFIQIGFYGVIKDQETMFKAFGRIAEKIDCHLTVVGEGFNVPEVVNLIGDLNISDKITFTGYVDNDLLPRYLKKAHFLLHTALFETGCAVVQEAMASGVVVAGTEVGILSDIGDTYAVLAPPRNPELLAERVLQLVSNPEGYVTIREKAYGYITAQDAVWSYSNYLEFIEKML